MSEHIALEPDITKIVIHYNDGTEEVISKGFVANIDDLPEGADGEAVANIKMVGMGGRDLYLLVESVLLLADKFGFFNRIKEAVNDEITETDIR